jgi:hypothetical protein
MARPFLGMIPWTALSQRTNPRSSPAIITRDHHPRSSPAIITRDHEHRT